MLEAGHRFPIGNSSMSGLVRSQPPGAHCAGCGRGRRALQQSVAAQPTRPNWRCRSSRRGQVLGALTIQSAQEAAFSDEDIETFQTMADQLANAIQNARLYEQLEQELEERKRAEMQVRQLNAEAGRPRGTPHAGAQGQRGTLPCAGR